MKSKASTVIIVILLLIIVGLVGFILGNKLGSKTNKEETKQETTNTVNNSYNATIEPTTTITDSNIIDAETQIPTNTNSTGTLDMTLTKKEVRKLTGSSSSFICAEYTPHITGIDSSIASKIEQELNNHYAEVWKDINQQTKDEEVKEIVDGYQYDIGFEQSYEVIYKSNNVVTFKHMLSGGLGGVSWNTTSSISFDLTTGEEINIADIVTNKDKYISTCKSVALEQLKADNRFEDVKNYTHTDNTSYESIINEGIEKMGGYFTDDGIVCVEIPKYTIAPGGDGEFRFTVSYEDIKDCINSKYVK